jgi:hypothetical protein
MTERDQSTTRRDAAERRELEAAGWEPKGHGVKTIWQSPADGRWYAHYQAVEMMKAEISPEEEHLLGEHILSLWEDGRERQEEETRSLLDAIGQAHQARAQKDNQQ